jgi:hypothetical protein
MPLVVGYSVGAVQQGLESDGIRVKTDFVWSGKPEDLILSQAPDAGGVIRAGDWVTLTVSGGTAVPIELHARLADLFTLDSAELARASYSPGDSLDLVLRWLPAQETDALYVVFVHLIASDGDLVAQRDEQPRVPTSAWVANQVTVDSHLLSIPRGAEPGVVQVRVGMYPPGQPSSRLPVVDPGLASVEANSVLVAEIEIAP